MASSLSKFIIGFLGLSYLSNNSSKLVPYCLDYCNEYYCEILILDWFCLNLVLIMDIVRQKLVPKLLTLVDDRGIFIFSENPIKYHRYFITDHFSERGSCLLTWQKVTEGPKDFYIVSGIHSNRFNSSRKSNIEFTHCNAHSNICEVSKVKEQLDDIFSFFIHWKSFICKFCFRKKNREA